ncbi:stage II sporulation protein M, partial [Stenotrophomonas maltophilia]
VAGHLQHIGHGGPFWRFVAGHGAFELTAIVIAGGAGLQLGMKLLAPGRRSRLDALVDGGRIGARLCLGVAFMLLVAAFIEAFWSSIAEVPAWTKLGVAGVLWAGVLLWLWRGGRGGGHAH